MKSLSASFSVSYQFPVFFVDNLFHQPELMHEMFSSAEGEQKLLLPVVEEGILQHFPELMANLELLFGSLPVTLAPGLLLPGGEQGKNSSYALRQIIEQCIEHQIDRHAYILAIGGGAFIDMVGYAATIIHRGIRLIRMPTTVLGQNDAGVGVKNAINYQGRKNFLGTFATPIAVINDYQFIAALPERDKRAGIAEAIKVALIKDKAFFQRLTNDLPALAKFDAAAMKAMIADCARLHLQHICQNGDPFERGSARPLDFGHWSAHALEELSGFQLRHGEAVAIGILLDSRYSFLQGWLSADEFAIIEHMLFTLGFIVCNQTLSQLDVHLALDNFRAHLGGQLCITMLQGIGYCHEVNAIDNALMLASVDYLLNQR